MRRLNSLFLFLFAAAGLYGTTIRPPEFEELVAAAETVVRTETIAVRSVWRGEGERRHIVTLVTLRVLNRVVGVADDVIELQFPGGTVGDRTMIVVGQPQFVVGSTDILFVRGNGRFLSPLVRMMHGRYPVQKLTAGDDRVLRDDRSPLRSVSDVQRPMEGVRRDLAGVAAPGEAMTVAAFERAVRETALTLGRKDVR